MPPLPPRRVLAFAAILALVTHAGAASASPVNAEVLRTDPFREGWSYGLDASFAWSRGNVDLLDVGGSTRLQYQTLRDAPVAVAEAVDGAPALPPRLRQRALLTASGRFAERSGTPFVNQSFVHARWTAMWHPQVGSDVFAQVQFHEFQRLRVRTVAGFGVRLVLAHRPRFLAWAGTGAMLEWERIDVQAGARDAPVSLAPRSTTYLTMRLAACDGRLLVQNTAYVQPRFDAFRDVRVLDELEVLGRITDRLALGFTFGVLHDSRPPTGVDRTDVRLANTLRLTF